MWSGTVLHLSPEDFEGTERFALKRRLGAGSFGVVYEALDLEQNTSVALKVLRQPDPNSLYRFKREFRSLTGMVHPNLVTLYELILNEERCFFTMELVAGLSFLEYVWGRRIAQRTNQDARTVRESELTTGVSPPLAPQTPLRMDLDLDRLQSALRQLSEGLSALHEAGKLHRDIKPSNVLVTEEGRLVVLDFGLVAELAPEDIRHSIAGTPAYMAPEQAIGGRATEASDWYSVGVMLYEALTGHLPFQGPIEEILRQKQTSEPLPPAVMVPGIPEELNSLCCDLLRRASNLRPSGHDLLQRLGKVQAPDRRVPSTPLSKRAPFVGRKSQLMAMGEAFAASQAGRTVVVCVEGKSGMGKSALVRRFLDDVETREKDVVALVGQCYEQESVPYKALDSLVDALGRYLGTLSMVYAEALMPRDVLALARVFPVLKQVGAISGARRRVVTTPDAKELRRRSFQAMRELLARLSDKSPIILFIDDLQWGDVDSAALLLEILRPPDPPPLLLVLGYRSDEAETSPMLRALLPVLRSGSGIDIRELTVDELSVTEAYDLASALLGNAQKPREDLIEHIIRESGGSPFFISELTCQTATDSMRAGPASFRGSSIIVDEMIASRLSLDDMIYRRIESLPADARRALEVVAVAGKPIPEQLARQAGRVEAAAYAKVLALLHSEHLIRTRETEFRSEIETYHDRVRETVVARLPAQLLKEHHRNLAESLEALRGADPETLAVHYRAAGNEERAAEYATLAAEQAFEAFAFDRSARLYSLAIELQTSKGNGHSALSIKLGDALASAGRGAEAAQAYMVAAPLASDAANRVELQRRAAEQLLRGGHIDEGLAILQQVLQTTGMRIAKTSVGAFLSVLRRRAYLRFRGLSFEERSSSEVPSEDLLRIDTCWAIGIGLGLVDMILAADYMSRHLLLALKAGEPQRITRALTGEAVAVSLKGVRSEHRAMELIDVASAIAERLHQPELTGRIILASGYVTFFNYRWQKTIDLTSQAEEIFRSQCAGVSWERNTAHNLSLRSLINQGRWSRIASYLPVLIDEAHERGDRLAETLLRLRMSFIPHLAADTPGEAPSEIEDAMQGWVNRGFGMQHYISLVARAQIELYCGRGLSAWELMTRNWSDMRRTFLLHIQLNRIEATHLCGRGALAALVDDGTASRDKALNARLLRSAEKCVDKLMSEGAPWATGLARLLQAGIASARSDIDRALNMLLLAEEDFKTADSMIFTTVARRCRGELVGGSAGDQLVQSSDEWMRSETIKNPARLASMLAPGRWRSV